MAMNVGPADGSGDMEVNSTINTTPLVDIMLVLLIIFLITIPVVMKTVPVHIPVASNTATKTKPENVNLSIDKDGRIFWNTSLVKDPAALLEGLKPYAVLDPQPEVHIRGDKDARYEYIGRVIVTVQRAGILKIGFITNPDLPGVQ
ncbi:MAG: biopolymer transporter ExbD [Rhodospirillaceae bacterium]|nr:MAG: biopolymer transporter ExbD [Rhodospirillaceae bacterium]